MSKLQRFAAAALAVLAVGSAHAGTISDGYNGATSGTTDSIGGSAYDITGATITRVGSVLKIVINTVFTANTTVYNGGSSSIKIGYGDLFLSNAWNPAGTAADRYASDQLSTTGTLWKYGLGIDTARFTTGAISNATVSLYQLKTPTTTTAGINGNNINSSDTVMAGQNPNLSGLTYRNGQSDTVNTGSSTVADTGSNGTLNVANGLVTFQIDISGTDMMNWTSFAMHWGETCQNDVIEGITRVVPEPGSMALLGLGLMGMLAMVRRKRA